MPSSVRLFTCYLTLLHHTPSHAQRRILGHHPNNFLRKSSNFAAFNPFVNISASCSSLAIGTIIMLFGFNSSLNQWYFIAKCFDLGVVLGGSIFASISHAELSSYTVLHILAISTSTNCTASHIVSTPISASSNH